jgi:SHS2 domain-containing protein
MPHEIIDHTADIKMRVWGDSLQNLFLEAVLAMMKMIKLPRQPEAGPPLVENTKKYEYTKSPERKIVMEAPDTTALLIDFLSEVLAFSQTNKEIYTQISFTEFGSTSLKAVLEGIKVDKFDEDIKAVTYHEADVEQNEKGNWETLLVFDI